MEIVFIVVAVAAFTFLLVILIYGEDMSPFLRKRRESSTDLIDEDMKALEEIERSVLPTTPPADEPAPVVYKMWDFSNHYNTDAIYSEGWDIHQKMLDIGAEELPENFRYSFFPSLRYPEGMKVGVAVNAVAIVTGEKEVHGKVFRGVVPDEGDLNTNFKIAAGIARSNFMRWYTAREAQRRKTEEERLRKQRIIEFAKGKPQMLVLGEEQEYVED